ncbi:hypothetical protein [Aquimarina algiphila]|uniref:Uncharacterized protein n=1 Tax=Aquimarina algiphila TaxID=2047982 RepID=A0A554VPF6_9FLAO|nr:hypothetical protein [Aquimarina algiphila]TSE10345.1 hypothetical protein FOF46_04740 [Aquimarina algiphila]
MKDRNPISSLLSRLLKKSLTTEELQIIATQYNVHYNTIINIRDRRKKNPDKSILKSMIKIAISVQEKQIKDKTELIILLEQELEKIV